MIIRIETFIAAPIERCFDLSRSIDLHLETGRLHMERVLSGRATGLISLGESVEWEAHPFGITVTHSSLIDEFSRPTYFRDVMVKGWFKYFRHQHHFQAQGNATLSRDELEFAAPAVLLDWPAKWYLRRFVTQRNRAIKQAAETDDWRRFLP